MSICKMKTKLHGKTCITQSCSSMKKVRGDWRERDVCSEKRNLRMKLDQKEERNRNVANHERHAK